MNPDYFMDNPDVEFPLSLMSPSLLPPFDLALRIASLDLYIHAGSPIGCADTPAMSLIASPEERNHSPSPSQRILAKLPLIPFVGPMRRGSQVEHHEEERSGNSLVQPLVRRCSHARDRKIDDTFGKIVRCHGWMESRVIGKLIV